MTPMPSRAFPSASGRAFSLSSASAVMATLVSHHRCCCFPPFPTTPSPPSQFSSRLRALQYLPPVLTPLRTPLTGAVPPPSPPCAPLAADSVPPPRPPRARPFLCARSAPPAASGRSGRRPTPLVPPVPRASPRTRTSPCRCTGSGPRTPSARHRCMRRARRVRLL